MNMRSQRVVAALISCLSIHVMAARASSETTQGELVKLVPTHVSEMSISPRAVNIKLASVNGTTVPDSAASLCVSPDAEIRLKKDNNAYFNEQFSTLLASHKLKQPVGLTLKNESGTCLIEEITVTH